MVNSQKFDLIALDIIEGLDGQFYIVDINGLVGLSAILQYQFEFENNLNLLFGKDFYFYSPKTIKNSEILKIGNQNEKSSIHVINNSFRYENKLLWRKKFQINSPKISKNIQINSLSDYPKILFKPEDGFGSQGIVLYNFDISNLKSNIFDNLILAKNECNIRSQSYFVEEFIPSKLINNHCYSIRILMIINENEFHPILFLNRKCQRPIISNLKPGVLNYEESLSYISNTLDGPKEYSLNEDYKIREFIKKINIHT